MQVLSPKVENALQGPMVAPVLYAEITTALFDKLIARYDDWTTATEFPGGSVDYVVSEHRTQVVNKFDDRVGNPPSGLNPFGQLQMTYPAQPGDPTQSVTGFDLMPDVEAVDLINFAIIGAVRGTDGFLYPNRYQSFEIGQSDVPALDVVDIKLKLTNLAGSVNTKIYLILMKKEDAPIGGFDIDYSKVVATSNSINSSSISSYPTWDEVSFTFPTHPQTGQTLQLKRGVEYVVIAARETQDSFFDAHQISWAYTNGHLYAGGYIGGAFSEGDRFPKQHHIKVNIKPYSYDGSTTNHREIQIDLGSPPVNGPATFDFDFEAPPGTTAVFKAKGADDSGFTSGVVDLGTVVDGQTTTELKRYWRIDIEFTSSTLLETPKVHKINVVYPLRVHRFSTFPIPALESLPFIQAIPSIPVHLDLQSYITKTQSFNLVLTDINGDVARMVAEENFKNLPCSLYLGFLNNEITSVKDLIPYASGKIIDYSFRDNEVTLEVEDFTKDLEVKVPHKTAEGAEKPAPIVFHDEHLIDVLDRLVFSYGRIQKRWKIDSEFSNAKTYLGDDWVTSRRLSDPEDARRLAEEILELTGYFMIPGEDGRIRLIQYPLSGNAVDTWTDDDILEDIEQEPSFKDSIINQCAISYGYDETFREYLFGYTSLDRQSQEDWAPGGQIYRADRTIETKWIASENLKRGQRLGKWITNRFVDNHKDGVIKIRCSTTLRKLRFQVGDMIDLQTPIFLRKQRVGSVKVAQKFMIVSKEIRFDDAEIDWRLAEVHDNDRPPIASFTVSAVRGIPNPTFTVNVDASASSDPDGNTPLTFAWDSDYDGVNFQEDDTGVTASFGYTAASIGVKQIACKVTNSIGKETILVKKVVIVGTPTARISMATKTNPGQPLNVILSGIGSESPTSTIVKWEWDLTYDGMTFNSEAVGRELVISMPFQSTNIGLRVTDQDGQTHIAELFLTGKQLAPPDVTNFRIERYGDKITLLWDANPDFDRLGVEIQGQYEPSGSQTFTWQSNPTDAQLITREEMSTRYTFPVPRPFGKWTFLIKYRDTSKNYSQNAVAILAEVYDPKDRNVIVTKDFVFTGWQGTHNQTMIEAATGYLMIAGEETIGETTTGALGGISDTPIWQTGPAFPSATFESDPIDLGAILSPIRISIDYDTTLLGSNASAAFEYAISDDDISYSPYASFVPTDLKFRYIKIKITLTQTDDASNIKVTNCFLTMDVPDRREKGEDIDVPVGGMTIKFALPFNVKPAIAPGLQGLTEPHFVEIPKDLKTKSQFFVRIRRSSDNADVGSAGVRLFDYIAEGY